VAQRFGKMAQSLGQSGAKIACMWRKESLG
jgi:hypothetical protein